MNSSDSYPRRRSVAGKRLLLGTGAAAIAFLGGRHAEAQLGSTNTPLPDVLLLVDNSGSFEHMIDGSNPEDAPNNPIVSNGINLYAECLAGNAAPPASWADVQGTIPNRWGNMVQALTGSISPAYNCYAMSRNTPPPSGFLDQYTINLTGASPAPLPYDFGYYLPYHRPLAWISGSKSSAIYSAYTPGKLPGAAGGTFGLTTTVPGSGGSATDWPAGAIGQQQFVFNVPGAAAGSAQGETNYLVPAPQPFSQLNNGAIDGATTLMRFGLMTFDNDPAPGTGIAFGASPYTCANTTASAFGGMWSYYPGWTGSAALAKTGWPSGCSTGFFELGARNSAAPPWEGRMVGFPNGNADTNAVSANNSLVQLAINAARPYGGTPTAGLITDAEYYYWGDPTGPAGPGVDPYAALGCRNQYIILLTDGTPNEDLRPQCGTNAHGSGGGNCPYDLAQNTAASLYGNGTTGADAFTGIGGPSVTTYVIGFAVSQISGTVEFGIAGCEQLATSGQFAQVCNTATGANAYLGANLGSSQYPQYQACCALQQIALAGSGGQTGAFFADTPADLNAAIGAVLGAIGKRVATRTLPAFATSSSYTTGNGSESLFLASFNAAAIPWRGDVSMEQLTCTVSGSGYAITQTSNLPGDDFQANLATLGPSGVGRNILVYGPPDGSLLVPPVLTTSGLTIRPFANQASSWIGLGDGLGTFGISASPGGEVGSFGTGGTNPITYNQFGSSVTAPHAFNITNLSCQDPVNRSYLTAADCTTVALDFAMAQQALNPGIASDPSFGIDAWTGGAPGRTSTIGPRVLNPIGGILHSTPAVSSAPTALLRDDSYQAFANDVKQFSPVRDPVLYVATTDGLLHAFDTVNTTANEGSPSPTIGVPGGTIGNNELWAFIPPGVLPNLLSEFYDASSIILDGAPVVRDMVWDRFTGGSKSCPSASTDQCWHTMLVAGFGGGGRGYYALDVTDPRPKNFKAYTTASFPTAATGALAQQGPHFQWQLASMQPVGTGAELFGKQSVTPALATILYDPACGTPPCNPHEVGVAILPGGLDGSPTGGACQRAIKKSPGNYLNGSDLFDGATHATRPSVRQWAQKCFASDPGLGSSTVAGRSVTIVRVDTGQVLAVFARNTADSMDVPNVASFLSAGVLINAPFDSPMTGTPVIYPAELGADAQRVFIGDADGTLWRLDLSSPNPAKWQASIFVDPYSTTFEGIPQSVPDSQPISVNPVVALNDLGDVTVEFATGDTSSFTSTYSIPGDTSGITYPVTNYVVAAQETPTALLGTYPGGTIAQLNWYLKLSNGERVSGPMVVFNNTLYFATFAPPLAAACSGGDPRIWGLDFTQLWTGACPLLPGAPTTDLCPTALGFGGIPRDFLLQSPSGVYTDPPDASGASTRGIVIPGLTVTYSPACIGGGTELPAAPMLTAAVGHPPTVANPTGTPVGLGNLRSSSNGGLPGTVLSNVSRTRLDSWAAIVE
jgi:type IV pilus assembly protein PilY1